MKKLKRYSSIVAIMIFFFIIIGQSTPILAGWNIPGSDICVGFGCSGPPVIGSDWMKQRWEEIGEGPESAAKICRQVGMDRCTNINFIQTFQLLRAGAYGKMYRDVNGCVATGLSLSEAGHEAARYIAIAKGVPIPKEVMNISNQMMDGDIKASCEYLYPGSFNSNEIAYFERGVYAKKNESDSIRKAIRGQSGSAIVKQSNARGLRVSNRCSHPIRLAVRYKKVNGTWDNAYWYNLKPNFRGFLKTDGERIRTRNSLIYYYANIPGTNYKWKGDQIKRVGNINLPMRKRSLNKEYKNDYNFSLTCNN